MNKWSMWEKVCRGLWHCSKWLLWPTPQANGTLLYKLLLWSTSQIQWKGGAFVFAHDTYIYYNFILMSRGGKRTVCFWFCRLNKSHMNQNISKLEILALFPFVVLLYPHTRPTDQTPQAGVSQWPPSTPTTSSLCKRAGAVAGSSPITCVSFPIMQWLFPAPHPISVVFGLCFPISPSCLFPPFISRR